jgi:hypothetical protein
VIKYALRCGAGHEFEGWFKNSAAFDTQADSSALSCPVCGLSEVTKAPMAPQIVRNAGLSAPPPAEVMKALKALRAAVIEKSEDVGATFAEEARKIHYDEAPARAIRGEATVEDARALLDEGIEVMPLPTLPEDRN